MTEKEVPGSIAAAGHEVAQLRADLDALSRQLDETEQRLTGLIARAIDENAAGAQIAAIPEARLLSDAVVLEGRAAERLRVRRLTTGTGIERSFSRYMGVTRCVTTATDVRALWERLLAFEQGSDDTLRGFPASVLDVPRASVAAEGDRLRIGLSPVPAERVPVLAVPRFAYHYAARKARNFGHWLLDCVPQVVAMQAIAPTAVFLIPEPVRSFHRSSLAMVGLGDAQIFEWGGAPVSADRVLVLERDGRAGGGRPLSSLLETRRLIADAGNHPPRDGRRIFVSRNDATAKRQWLTNEAEVERLFRSRGFEIISMSGRSLEEQRALFSDTGVVAGSSGAGLADMIFAPRGIHVMVLVSDSLVRWYAKEEGTRSLWAGDRRGHGKELAALGDSPRFYAHLAALFEQVCHTFVGPDEMPLLELSSFIDAALAQVPSP